MGRCETMNKKDSDTVAFRAGIWNFDRNLAPCHLAQNHGAAGEEITGRQAVVAMIGGYFTAFPDMNTHVEDVFGEGDRVFTRVRLEGTNTGELMGMPATGKRVEIRWLMNAARLEDGKVIEEWEIFDRMDMMAQLGHLPEEG